MFLFDYLGAQASQWDTKLLATDISNRAMTAAKKGVYELPDTIPADWKKKYFIPQSGGQYQVAPRVRDNVIYQPFNLMDPIKFRRKFDVIFCRNVMIYFDQPTKDALVRRFYDATVPGGYLMISHSENLGKDNPYQTVAPLHVSRSGSSAWGRRQHGKGVRTTCGQPIRKSASWWWTTPWSPGA